MKYIIILLLILAYFGCVCAQQPDLLRLTMQSDLILFIEMADDVGSTEYKNDFTMEHHVTFRKVERIIKNKYRDDPLRIRAKQPMEGEDYYDENILNGGSSSGVAYMLEYGEKEYRMYFIRRQGEQYVAIARLYYNFDWEKVIVDIQSVMEIEKEGDPAKRFNMSMQWYKSRNQRPPYRFIAYYKQTGMITDTVRIDVASSVYTQYRIDESTGWFKKGCTDLYCRDSTGVIYDWRTGLPFTGYLQLYRNAIPVAEFNLVNGWKQGWQTNYENGKVLDKYYYKEKQRSSPTFGGIEKFYKRETYDKSGHLKESLILACDTAFFYQCREYYPSGKTQSEGYIQLMCEKRTISAATLLSRPVKLSRRQRKHLNDRITIIKTDFYKTGRWVNYNEDGSKASEDNYEIYKNEYGEIRSRKTGEWKDDSTKNSE